jgi:hypothetical protein
MFNFANINILGFDLHTIFHIFIIIPMLFYIGFKNGKVNPLFFKALMAVSVILLIKHGGKAFEGFGCPCSGNSDEEELL